MAADTADPVLKGPQVPIQSKDHEELLDIVDTLRSQGISRFIDLPQLIVCGDQSSGKSSVLEAVSGLSFPTNDNLCTRFATELILRRVPEASAAVTIIPDQATHSEKDQKRLSAFRAAVNIAENFGSVVREAEKCMSEGLDQAFYNDVLRIEISGPAQPHLTLIDLPGLFHAGNRTQTVRDAESVTKMVISYMEKSRSIILAVVQAKNDLANQVVMKYAKQYDPQGERTSGIITKPDTLYAGSDSELQFFELAQNKDVVLMLGWHVLKNRDFYTRETTIEERDESERQFFYKGIWTNLQIIQLGIEALRYRLSIVLKDQIVEELPGLIRDVETGIRECTRRMDNLGGSRRTVYEQREYLHNVSQRFCDLVKIAIKGPYNGAFFGDPNSREGTAKRLRALLMNKLELFADEIAKRGHHKQVVETPPKKPQTSDETTSQGIFREILEPALQPLKKALDEKATQILDQHLYNYPITFNKFLTDNIQKAKDDHNAKMVAEKLQSFFHVDPRGKNSQAKVPISPDGVARIDTKDLLCSLTQSTKAEMKTYACSEALACMEAYYKVAMKFVVDDFGIHTIEECLLKKLPEVFNPKTVLHLNNETIETIAAETAASQVKRETCSIKLEALQNAPDVLQRLDRNKSRAPKINMNGFAKDGSEVKDDMDFDEQCKSEEDSDEDND